MSNVNRFDINKKKYKQQKVMTKGNFKIKIALKHLRSPQ